MLMNAVINLKQQILACHLCQADLPLPAKPIVQLSQHSKILIAGQAPGIKAHEKGLPFHDASGKRLRDWLGVTEEQFYDDRLFAILPMGFCFPGTIIRNGKKSGDKPPMAQCAKTWRASVLKELNHVELTIILGQYAIDYHLTHAQAKTNAQPKKLSVTDAVMNWQEYWPENIVLPHPSPRNNIWIKRHPQFETDILPVLKQRVSEILSP
ncbi:uracil-DNA glycosylase family protein [Shewanella eurypsychrophilus]|uniref:Uracil-DNA glycosylase family protein n=1 Tax=Shewanella eurypsychrophilus TaxID=2593656 RepID=A0ABX6V9X7_9GAMM|nr:MULTISPECIES: uracil-DNA glycosylase family protein [Shewanella]QFU22005.1 uracil-DNA glycosylase family protein [Shewanella sp. YLB-09]QPG57294.1 uracil-DNA glycosylase family protein [Shewanella eurypsychrophilus]